MHLLRTLRVAISDHASISESCRLVEQFRCSGEVADTNLFDAVRKIACGLADPVDTQCFEALAKELHQTPERDLIVASENVSLTCALACYSGIDAHVNYARLPQHLGKSLAWHLATAGNDTGCIMLALRLALTARSNARTAIAHVSAKAQSKHPSSRTRTPNDDASKCFEWLFEIWQVAGQSGNTRLQRAMGVLAMIGAGSSLQCESHGSNAGESHCSDLTRDSGVDDQGNEGAAITKALQFDAPNKENRQGFAHAGAVDSSNCSADVLWFLDRCPDLQPRPSAGWEECRDSLLEAAGALHGGASHGGSYAAEGSQGISQTGTPPESPDPAVDCEMGVLRTSSWVLGVEALVNLLGEGLGRLMTTRDIALHGYVAAGTRSRSRAPCCWRKLDGVSMGAIGTVSTGGSAALIRNAR